MDAGAYDEKRTLLLERAGFCVLRFWNNDVFAELDGVLEVIRRELVASYTIPTQPSP